MFCIEKQKQKKTHTHTTNERARDEPWRGKTWPADQKLQVNDHSAEDESKQLLNTDRDTEEDTGASMGVSKVYE